MIKKNLRSSVDLQILDPLFPTPCTLARTLLIRPWCATRVHIRPCVDRFYRNATLQREVEQFAQQTGAFGLFINVLPAFKIPIPSIFFSHPLPGGDRFYRDTTVFPPFIFVSFGSIFFFFSPIDISFSSKSIGSFVFFFSNNENIEKKMEEILFDSIFNRRSMGGGAWKKINYQPMRSEFPPPPSLQR